MYAQEYYKQNKNSKITTRKKNLNHFFFFKLVKMNMVKGCFNLLTLLCILLLWMKNVYVTSMTCNTFQRINASIVGNDQQWSSLISTESAPHNGQCAKDCYSNSQCVAFGFGNEKCELLRCLLSEDCSDTSTCTDSGSMDYYQVKV